MRQSNQFSIYLDQITAANLHQYTYSIFGATDSGMMLNENIQVENLLT